MHPPRPTLGIPSLDCLLKVFCAPAHALPGPRRSSPELNEDVYGHEQDESSAWWSTVSQAQRLRWKPIIIELTSSLPASGKTNFLYYATALAVLPRDHGGHGALAVWFDTDGRFSATRLREVVYGVSLSASSAEDRDSIVQDAMTHVHVFRPQSSRQLIDTLDCLPSYLLDPTAHPSIRRRLALLVLDSATAFYWQDRFDSETARFQHPDQPRATSSQAAEVITRMKKVQKEFDCAVMFSTTANPASSAGRHEPIAAVEHAAPREARSISPWTAFAKLSLKLSRVEVPKFASHMSLQEYSRDQAQRQEAVSKESFVAEVDRSAADSWTRDVKDAIRRMEAESSFGLSIGTAVSLSDVRR